MSSDHLFGIHDYGGEEHMLAAGKPGWIVFSEAIGHDPYDRGGKDYTPFSSQGLDVIVRLNNGYYPQGTLPPHAEYGNFARRCANFVAASRGCTRWVIGNEMNYVVERPGAPSVPGIRSLVGDPATADPTLRSLPERFSALLPAAAGDRLRNSPDAGEPITPDAYARCFRLCREAIRLVPGHERDKVVIGAVAPWNTQTTYPGNPGGDWIKYFQDILLQLGPDECDGIALHTFTHGSDPALITDSSKLQSFPQHHYHFQVYRDFMHAVPANMRHLPVYITETDQVNPWENTNRGWVQAAYAEIDRWNRQNDQKIRALVLHRWPRLDRWHIEGKSGVIEDFRSALRHDYRWNKQTSEQPRPVIEPRRAPAPPAPRQQAQPARQQAVPDGSAFRAQWLKGKLPRPLLSGQQVQFPVTIRNTGTTTWPASGTDAVSLSYHFFQNREELSYPGGRPLQTPLPHDVAPGAVATVDAQVLMPEQPGNYTLILDLMRGKNAWFQQMQSDVLTRWLSVTEPRRQRVPEPAPTPESAVASPPQTASQPAVTAATGGSKWSGTGPLASGSGQPASVQPESVQPKLSPAADRGPLAAAPQPPTIQDISTSLPRGQLPFASRTAQQVRRLVICHTGAPAGVPVQAIAQAHVDQGYPGIAYHYFVLATGELLQVSALDAVVNGEAEWSLTGVNICLEGNFDQEVPSPEQLAATAQLCAWLLPRYQLTTEDVVGLAELLDTSSPGATFSTGPTWKLTLHEQIAILLAQTASATQAQTTESVPPVQLGAVVAPTATDPPPTATVARLPRPPIEDVIVRLPRDPQGFFRREPEDIQYIVINHTAAPANTPLPTIAEAFRRKLPGILYQFFVAPNGALYQTQPLMQVVDGELPYIAQAINIGFAGEFNNQVPTPAQIEAGSQLIAWLLSEFPQLTLASIRGVNEFIEHTSPGEQWLRGRRWKDILINQVAAAAEIPEPQPVAGEADGDGRFHRLQDQVDSLNQQMEALRQENDRLRQEISQLRSDPNRWRQIVRPRIRDISETLPQHPSLRYRRRQLSAITHVAVHHTALPPHIGPARIATVHITEDPDRGKEPWPGIGYHFFVRAEGDILQTQPLDREVYHVAGHNPYTVAVVFAGSFMNGFAPTSQQIHAGARLIAWLLQEYRIPVSNVLGHREFPDNRTVCPGTEWMDGKRWRNTLYEEVVRIQRGEGEKPLFHYLLFPSNATLSAGLSRASDYFEKFSPSAGTRLDDALQARYVTLVGAGSGFTDEDEQRLLDAKVEIDRLEDEEDSPAVAKLQSLADEGRRFLTLMEDA